MEGQEPAAYTRVIAMLRVAHELLKEGKTASQGDIYNRYTCLCHSMLVDMTCGANVWQRVDVEATCESHAQRAG